jgi:hypothetical protein
MGLFGKLIKGAIHTVSIPIDIVKDVKNHIQRKRLKK